MKRATKLSEVRDALSTEPLVERGEFRTFYAERFDDKRLDVTAKMARELEGSRGGVFYRRFLAGPGGCGKSTELTRLGYLLEDKFEFVRLSGDDLSSSAAQAFDLVELMAMAVVERTSQFDLEFDRSLLEDLHAWFGTVVVTDSVKAGAEASVEMGAGASTPSLLKSLLDIFVKARGEASLGSSRTKETVERRLRRLSELRDLANRVFLECGQLLSGAKNGKDWVILLEDFDKPSVSRDVLEQLFVVHGNLWTQLRVHMICTIPLWLTLGEPGSHLKLGTRMMADIPVFDPGHRPDTEGRAVLGRILAKRIADDLFEPGVKEHLIQAAGGNVRDMFTAVYESALVAQQAGVERIGMRDAESGVNWLRNQYEDRLGDREIRYDQKVPVLLNIYNQGSGIPIQDEVLHRLLQTRAVHRYNDRYWYGVPPMVVEILKQQGHLDPSAKGGLEPEPEPEV